MTKLSCLFFVTIALVEGLPPPRFGNQFGSPQLDEVGDPSNRVDVSAISDMYREREETLNTAIKMVEKTAKATNKTKDDLIRTVSANDTPNRNVTYQSKSRATTKLHSNDKKKHDTKRKHKRYNLTYITLQPKNPIKIR